MLIELIRLLQILADFPTFGLKNYSPNQPINLIN